MQLLEDNSDEVAGSGSDPDVNWKGWIRTSIGRVGSDVNWKGWKRRWKGHHFQKRLEGLDLTSIGKVGRDVGRDVNLKRIGRVGSDFD